MPSYTNLIADISSTIVVEPTNAAFLAIFPQWINAAEGRVYRELNLLDASVRDSSASCTPSSRCAFSRFSEMPFAPHFSLTRRPPRLRVTCFSQIHCAPYGVFLIATCSPCVYGP